MMQYSINNLKENLEKIVKENIKWSFSDWDGAQILRKLPEVVKDSKLFAKAVTNLEPKVIGTNLSIFNAINSTIGYTLPIKFAQDAIDIESKGQNADHIWNTLLAVLQQAQTLNCIYEIDNSQIKGVNYLSLGRGWDGNQDITGGIKIIKLMMNNNFTNSLEPIVRNPIKTEIFNILLEEASKKDNGLFANPDSHKKYPTVMDAYKEYENIIENEEFLVLGVRWNSVKPEENSNLQDEAGEERADHLIDDSDNMPSTSRNISTDTKLTTNYSIINVKEKINDISAALKQYNEESKNLEKMGIDIESIKTILETGDTKKYLVKEIINLTKSLEEYYNSLDFITKSYFLESNEFQALPRLIEELTPIAYQESKDLKYKLSIVIVEGANHPLQQLGSIVGGNSLAPLKETAEIYIKWYKEEFLRNVNTHEEEELSDGESIVVINEDEVSLSGGYNDFIDLD